MTTEQQARGRFDALLEQAGWAVQNAASLNISAARGIAVREFGLKSGHGAADYLLYVDQKAAGVIEAKPAGYTLTGVENSIGQVQRGSAGHAARAPQAVALSLRDYGRGNTLHQPAGP